MASKKEAESKVTEWEAEWYDEVKQIPDRMVLDVTVTLSLYY